jgi:transcriptional regulator with XRE-family HTH domain
MAADAKSHGTLIGLEINADPEFRREWERTALARVVAAELIGYRADNNLSQTKLAERLGCTQPYIAKLESGESNPSVETLIHLSRELGIEFMIDIAPTVRVPQLVTKRVREQHAAQEQDGVSVVFAAASAKRSAPTKAAASGKR